MQASKIQVGGLYAVKRGGVEEMFKVEKILTTRNDRGTLSQVVGEFVEEPHERGRIVEVSDVLGPYEEFAFLAEKKRLAEQARKDEEDRKRDRAEKTFRAFHRHLGIAVPKKDRHGRLGDYNDPFYMAYSNTIEVTHAGMDVLAKFLKVEGEQ